MMRPMRFLALCCALLAVGCSGGGREVNPARLLGRPMTVPADLWERYRDKLVAAFAPSEEP